MPFAGNFHPELGYLAPAPKFVRAVRTMLVASAIGAVAGAGTVLALMDRPPTDVRKAARPVAQAALITGTPQTAETPVAAAALTELNAGPAQTATAKIAAGKLLERNAASSRGAARTQTPEIAAAAGEDDVPAIAAAEDGAKKSKAKKHRKVAHHRSRMLLDTYSSQNRSDRNYAYRQW
jgi:hypothetical protein